MTGWIGRNGIARTNEIALRNVMMERSMKGVPVSDEAKAQQKRYLRRRRLWVYGGLLAGLYAAYLWQPYEYDFIPRALPSPNPRVDPDRTRLFAKGTRILVVSAHPDDSEFYIGGTLTQLGKTADITQVICTDGDKGYYGPFANPAENRQVRQREAQAAHQTWHGHGVTFLSHPDGRLRANDILIDQLVQIIRQRRPDYILAFDGEYPPRMSHQDHRRSGDAALEAARRSGLPVWCLLFSTIAPNFIVDITDQWDDKVALLKVHRSQFHGTRLEKVTNMVAGLAEEDGERGGFTMGEGFRCVRLGR